MKIKIPKEVRKAIIEALEAEIDPEMYGFGGPARRRGDALTWVLKYTQES